MTRTEQITALLTSLYDYLPSPKTARYGDLPGPAPTTSAPCKSCGGVGTFGKRHRPCAACEGKGTVQIDAYTGEPVGTEGQRVRAADPRRIDAELAKLAQNEELRRGRHLDDPFAWEAERIRYRRAGDYAVLERALEGLRANEPDLYSLVMRVLVYGTVSATDTSQPHLDQALEWIARRMPPQVRVPRWVTAAPEKVERDWPADRRRSAARDERNAEIVRLAGEGLAGTAIAAQIGVSKATVSRVLSSVSSMAGSAA